MKNQQPTLGFANDRELADLEFELRNENQPMNYVEHARLSIFGALSRAQNLQKAVQAALPKADISVAIYRRDRKGISPVIAQGNGCFYDEDGNRLA